MGRLFTLAVMVLHIGRIDQAFVEQDAPKTVGPKRYCECSVDGKRDGHPSVFVSASPMAPLGPEETCADSFLTLETGGDVSANAGDCP